MKKLSYYSSGIALLFTFIALTILSWLTKDIELYLLLVISIPISFLVEKLTLSGYPKTAQSIFLPFELSIYTFGMLFNFYFLITREFFLPFIFMLVIHGLFINLIYSREVSSLLDKIHWFYGRDNLIFLRLTPFIHNPRFINIRLFPILLYYSYLIFTCPLQFRFICYIVYFYSQPINIYPLNKKTILRLVFS